jgi:DNA-binding transcriptional ArsR family regulator
MRPKQLKAKDLRAFAVVPIRALKDARITPKMLRVLVAFCSYADHMGRTFVSMERVGQDIGSSRTAVSNHVSKLKKLGYIVYAKPLWRGQRSISRRIVFDPHVKLEETIRSRLSPKQQMQLSEAETMAKMEHEISKNVTNSQFDLGLSELREEFECLTRDFFTSALAKGWRIKPEAIDRAKIMLATQAVELLSEPHSDERAA